jgi:CHAD domain-containing protein
VKAYPVLRAMHVNNEILPHDIQGPTESPMPLDVDRALKPLKKLRKSVKKFPKQPSPEQVHDLRTSTRKIEATLEALALDASRNGRKLLSEVARVRKPAGKVRDMDVLTGFASTLDVDGERECAVELLEYLGAQRYKRARELRGAVKQYRPDLTTRLKRSATKIEKLVREADKGNGDSQDPRAEAAALAIKLSQDLSNPPRLDRNNLHPYRLKVKELRYVLQLAGGAADQQFIEELGKVKDAIGEWHDWGELIAIASEVLEHEGECKLIGEIKKIHQRKYDEALEITNRMRTEYLGGTSERQRKGRGKGHAQIGKPALVAAAAIAA